MYIHMHTHKLVFLASLVFLLQKMRAAVLREQGHAVGDPPHGPLFSIGGVMPPPQPASPQVMNV